MKFKSNRKDIDKALSEAEKRALHAIKIAGDSWVSAETPVRTGNLRNSNVSEINETNKSVIFGNNAEYSVFVHEGTQRQAKQPFIRRPIETRGRDLKRLASEAYRGVFK